MIKIKKIGFSNMLSYGQDTVFRPTARVTQLVGPNGVGKSGIPVILEELLFNKNSRGIKKADIENYETDIKGYSGYVDFEVGTDAYKVTKVVTSTAKVKLTKNGEDISGHTTTQTYKIIEQILGIDFSTFTKLVYQSMVSSLDFLTATDANRKKFLVSLLGLERYVETEKILKEEVKSAKNSVANAQGAVTTIKTWLKENEVVPDKLETLGVPEAPEDSRDALLVKVSESSTVELHNSIVKDNIANIQAAAKIETVKEAQDISIELAGAADSLRYATSDLAVCRAAEVSANAEHKKIDDIKEKCHTCGSVLDVGDKIEMLAKAAAAYKVKIENSVLSKQKLQFVQDVHIGLETQQIEFTRYTAFLKAMDAANARLDSSKPTNILTVEELQIDIVKLKTDILAAENAIKLAERHNSKVEAKNATREFQLTQLAKFKTDLNLVDKELEEHQVLLARLEVLASSFGAKGIIAYKVESMVKSFELLINEYLQVLSDGRFTLSFSVEDSKLSLNIKKGTRLVDIKSLSSGEFNKVNTATLLAVRKMMTSISKTDINLLFLDEVVSVLDTESKDTLIEVLLKEEALNSIVVSHGYQHPLAAVITVTKTNEISELET